MKFFCSLLLACLSTVRSEVNFETFAGSVGVNAYNARFRIIQLMRGIVMDNQRRINDMRDFRYMYEETPHYEIGYVFGEIVERYRKLVEIARRCTMAPGDFYNVIYNLQDAQTVYLELYHLVNMLHEIIPKYQNSPEFQHLKDELWYLEALDSAVPGSKPPIRVDRLALEKEQRERMLAILKFQKLQKKLMKEMFKKQKDDIGSFNVKKIEFDGEGGFIRYFDAKKVTKQGEMKPASFKYHYKADGSVVKYQYFTGNASWEISPWSKGSAGWYEFKKSPDFVPRPVFHNYKDYGWEIDPGWQVEPYTRGWWDSIKDIPYEAIGAVVAGSKLLTGNLVG